MGNLNLGKSVWLAPMAGITDAPFRKLVMSFGASYVITEMVSSESITRGNVKSYKRLIKFEDAGEKIVQIFGCDPKAMGESAKINVDLGASMININMGCPAKKIVNGNAGSALMKDENLACKIVEEVVSYTNVPVSVKMRLGWDCEHLNAVSLAEKFENLGVSMIMVHGRTRAQGYSGIADMRAIRDVKMSVGIPVVCNGDINYMNCEDSLKESCCDGLMVGRAALGMPWLLSDILKKLSGNESQIHRYSNEEVLDIVLAHFEENLLFYGKDNGIKNFRKHFCWYSKGISGASEFRSKINVIEDRNEIVENLKRFFYK